jgi:hypothetical protein
VNAAGRQSIRRVESTLSRVAEGSRFPRQSCTSYDDRGLGARSPRNLKHHLFTSARLHVCSTDCFSYPVPTLSTRRRPICFGHGRKSRACCSWTAGEVHLISLRSLSLR